MTADVWSSRQGPLGETSEGLVVKDGEGKLEVYDSLVPSRKHYGPTTEGPTEKRTDASENMQKKKG